MKDPPTDPDTDPRFEPVETEEAEIIMPDDSCSLPSGPPVVPANPNEPEINPTGPVVPSPVDPDQRRDGPDLPK